MQVAKMELFDSEENNKRHKLNVTWLLVELDTDFSLFTSLLNFAYLQIICGWLINLKVRHKIVNIFNFLENDFVLSFFTSEESNQ